MWRGVAGPPLVLRPRELLARGRGAGRGLVRRDTLTSGRVMRPLKGDAGSPAPGDGGRQVSSWNPATVLGPVPYRVRSLGLLSAVGGRPWPWHIDHRTRAILTQVTQSPGSRSGAACTLPLPFEPGLPAAQKQGGRLSGSWISHCSFHALPPCLVSHIKHFPVLVSISLKFVSP